MHPLLAWPYRVAVRVADLVARLPLRGDSKLLRSLRARRDSVAPAREWAAAQRDLTKPLIWFHAPSVGEGLQARPVIQLLRERRPDVQIAYTHFSPSAERFAASVGADFHGYLPFDTAANGNAMLEALRPSALVYSKLDVWPTLTSLAASAGVRVGMISATLAEGSGRRGALAAALLHDAYAALTLVGAVDAADAQRLTALGVPAECVRVTGDTRYDQVAARAATRQAIASTVAALGTQRPTLVAGSTWPADEKVLLAVWPALKEIVPDARLVIAPHEPSAAHCAPIERWADDAALRCARLDAAQADSDVVLVDRVGVLGDLYALASVAYVGGGFHAAGLHSVIEPAAFGVPVLFGPRHHMSRDARLLYENRGGEAVGDVAECLRALRILFTEDDTRTRAGAAALTVVRNGLGAAERSVKLVLDLLNG